MAVVWKKILTEVDIIDEDDMASNLDTKVPTQQSVKAYVDSLCISRGTVTLANTRLSLVSGTAFVDFSASSTLTPFGGCKIILIDSAGKKAVGYIKSAGTGETLGDELVTNGTFDSDTTGWAAIYASLASVAGGQSGNCLEITYVASWLNIATQTLSTSAGALLKPSIYVKSGTSGNERYDFGLTDDTTPYNFKTGTSSASWVAASGYSCPPVVAPKIRVYKYSATAGTMLFDTISVKQVLTPSATGVTITSTPGGTTYNWTSIEAGFNYNDLSGYTYTISPSIL